MPFSVTFRPDALPGSSVGDAALIADIELGDETDAFDAFIGYWSPADYCRQWLQGVARAVRDGQPSCLVSSIEDPHNIVWWYLLYPDGDVVHVQHALFLPEERGPFPTADPYPSVPAYVTVDEDGEPVSQWLVPRQDMLKFLAADHTTDGG